VVDSYSISSIDYRVDMHHCNLAEDPAERKAEEMRNMKRKWRAALGERTSCWQRRAVHRGLLSSTKRAFEFGK
jgi:hypothetical protein